MKTHFRNKGKFCSTGASNLNNGGNVNSNSSSSGQPEVCTPLPTNKIRSVVDIVDSSDEHYMKTHYRNDWNSKVNPLQPRRCSAKPPPSQIAGNCAKVNRNTNQSNCMKAMPCKGIDMEDEEGNEQLMAGDYKVMSETPMSIGGHFQFASEKHWAAADSDEQSQLERTEASEYFTLNLKLLNLGLQTIPFYKRMDYQSSLFTWTQIEAMEKLAESAEKAYQPVLEDHIRNPRSVKNDGSKSLNKEEKQQKMNGNGDKKAEKPLDELDELLSMTDTGGPPIANEKVSTGLITDNHLSRPATASAHKNGNEVAREIMNKDDIEEWLDNVLDE